MAQLILGILIFAGVGAAAGVFLSWLSGKFRVQESPKADRIYDILPHTECGQCGHPGCRPYANAVAEGKDTCNKCIPGGRETAAAIARIMGIDPSEAEAGEAPVPGAAFIDESRCIGCGKCQTVCPVDCIVGASRMKHTVIRKDCTGCGKCVKSCPTECIIMDEIKEGPESWDYEFSEESLR